MSSVFQIVGHLSFQYYCKSSRHRRTPVDGFDDIYPAFAHTICLRNMPHSVTICLRYGHGWIMSYIMCPFVERLLLSPTAHSHIVAHPRHNTHMHDHCQSTCCLVIQYLFFFGIFSLDATLKCILLAVDLSAFGHRPGYFTTIDFWFGLEHPSGAKSSVISQMSFVTVLHVRCIIYCLPSGRSFCLRAHTTHVTPVEPSAMLSIRWVYHSFRVACV